MNVTVVGAAGYGWLRAYPYGGSSTASIINYNAGDTIANGLVMPICDPATASCGSDLTVVADSYGGHVIIDVMGYWAKVNKAQYRTFTVETTTSAITAMPASPGCANYMSVAVTAPVAGRILVSAHNQVQASHVTGTGGYYYFGIATTISNCSFTMGEGIYLNYPAALPTATYYGADTVFNVFDVTAGTYTYYLNGYRGSTSATANFWWAAMWATFSPS